MKYWFIIHNLISYSQHNNLIGNRVESAGIPKPRFSKFSDIEQGDRVVYYASGDYVVPGIFEIISDMRYLEDDKEWGESIVYEIKPVYAPPPGFYLDFKKLVLDSGSSFDMFPDKHLWGSYLQGQTCKELSDNDYRIIEAALSNNEFLKYI